jgi:hypothetical protein
MSKIDHTSGSSGEHVHSVTARIGTYRRLRVGYERDSSSPSKKVRTAVGRQTCLVGCVGRAEKHQFETCRQMLAAPRKSKRSAR